MILLDKNVKVLINNIHNIHSDVKIDRDCGKNT